MRTRAAPPFAHLESSTALAVRRGRERARIERVGQDLHANVTRNHRCKTMKALLEKAREYLTRYVWRRVTGVTPILQMAADQGVV